MDFDIGKKNKPNLIDKITLAKVLENKKPEIIYEPTLIDKIFSQTKNYIYQFIEDNIFRIIFIIIIIVLLIYRYFQYKCIKEDIQNTIKQNINDNKIQQNFINFNKKPKQRKRIKISKEISKPIITTYNSNNLDNYELLN